MQVNDFERFHAVMTGIAEVHQRELSKFTLDVYWLALSAWDLSEFESAAGHLLQTLKWMPKPSDFTALRTAGQPTAGEAWELVLSGADIEPGSRVHRAAAIVGGQYTIRHADIEYALPHIQRRFMEAYDELSDVDPVRKALPQIAQHGARTALRGPVSLAGVVSRLEGPISHATTQPARINPLLQLQAPTPAKPPVVVTVADKIAKLIALNMSDVDIAKVSGASIEEVSRVRAGMESAA